MSKTQEYYYMKQRDVNTFSKYPQKEADKDGISPEENAKMFQIAKDHQGMIRDMVDGQKRFGKRTS